MFQVFLMYALFASIFPLGKMTLYSVSPYFLTGCRMLIAAFILLAYQFYKERDAFYLQKKHIPLLLGVTVFNVFITNAFEFWALQYLGAANTSLIYTLTIFISMLAGYVFLDETMNKKKWLGLFVGLAGAVPIFWHEGASFSGVLSLPEWMMVIAAFTASIGWLMVKLLRSKYNYPVIMINGLSFLGGGILSLATSVAIEPWNPVPVTSWSPFLWGVLYIALIHNVICYHIYAKSLNRFSVTFMSFAGIVNPLFAALISWFLLDETVGIPFFIALFFVFSGLYLFSTAESKYSYTKGYQDAT